MFGDCMFGDEIHDFPHGKDDLLRGHKGYVMDTWIVINQGYNLPIIGSKMSPNPRVINLHY